VAGQLGDCGQAGVLPHQNLVLRVAVGAHLKLTKKKLALSQDRPRIKVLP